MEPTETLGCCLGIAMLLTTIQGAPEKLEIKIAEEEEMLFYPPLMMMYSLDGQLKIYQVFNGLWEENLLSKPQPIAASSSSNVQQPQNVQSQVKPATAPAQSWQAPPA